MIYNNHLLFFLHLLDQTLPGVMLLFSHVHQHHWKQSSPNPVMLLLIQKPRMIKYKSNKDIARLTKGTTGAPF